MRLIIAAIGRMKSGPEKDLVARYLDRLSKTGKAIGINRVDVVELVESRASSTDERKREETEALLAKLPSDCILVAFDERGKTPDSLAFAATMQNFLDSGADVVALVIGGPDGLSSDMRKRADQLISFGALTMPHQIVRIMVAEQAYRATTILTGHPYHRI